MINSIRLVSTRWLWCTDICNPMRILVVGGFVKWIWLSMIKKGEWRETEKHHRLIFLHSYHVFRIITNSIRLISCRLVQKTASSLKDTGIEFFSFYAPSLPRFVQRIKRISLRYSAILRGCGKDRMGREAFSSRIGNPPLPSIWQWEAP